MIPKRKHRRRAIAFTDFCRKLGVELYPGQRVLASVMFDQVDPRDLEGEDRAIARELFGDVDVVPETARQTAAVMAGARGGKSYVVVALKSLHAALTAPLDGLAPGEEALALIVAPDLRTARHSLKYAKAAAEDDPNIRRCLGRRWVDGFEIQREDGRVVRVECLPASKGGAALRGRSLVSAALEEAAFFRDSAYAVNDAEILRAVAPRILPSGQLVICSTPYAESGVLFELWRDNWGRPSSAVVARAPTVLLNPTKAAEVERERQRDPSNCRREFDAFPMSGGAGVFFDAATIEAAVDEDLPAIAAPVPGVSTWAAADFGFVSDSSALVILQSVEGAARVVRVLERRPKRGKPLVPSLVIGEFARIAKAYGARRLLADHHYRRSVEEHLGEAGIWLDTGPRGVDGKARSYLVTRELMRSGLLRLPQHHRLIAQLREVISKPLAGGGLSVSSPRKRGSGPNAGGHGDLVSALVLAAWAAHRDELHGRKSRYVAPPRSGDPTLMGEELRLRREARKFYASRDTVRVDGMGRGVVGIGYSDGNRGGF